MQLLLFEKLQSTPLYFTMVTTPLAALRIKLRSLGNSRVSGNFLSAVPATKCTRDDLLSVVRRSLSCMSGGRVMETQDCMYEWLYLGKVADLESAGPTHSMVTSVHVVSHSKYDLQQTHIPYTLGIHDKMLAERQFYCTSNTFLRCLLD